MNIARWIKLYEVLT